MRIFNATKSHLDLPLTGMQRIQVPAHSVSGDFMPNTEFLSLLVGSYDYSEIALIVSGPYEINMCSGVSGSVGFVVQSIEEAIERFTPKTSLKNEDITGEEVKDVPVEVEQKEEEKPEVKEEKAEEVSQPKEKTARPKRRWDKKEKESKDEAPEKPAE